LKEETKQKMKLAGWSLVETASDIAVIAAGILTAEVIKVKVKNEEN